MDSRQLTTETTEWKQFQKMHTMVSLEEWLAKNKHKDIWSAYAKSYNIMIPHIHCYQELTELVLLDSLEILSNRAFSEQKILDLGTGTGHMIKKLGNHRNGFGVEKNPLMLAYAKMNNANTSNAFTLGDMETMDFQSNEHDLLVFSNSLYPLSNPVNMLTKTYDLVKPGGLVIVAGPKPGFNLEEIMQQEYPSLIEKQLHKEFPEDFTTFVMCNKILSEQEINNAYTNEEMEVLLEILGFSIVESQSIYYGQSHYVTARKHMGTPEFKYLAKNNPVHQLPKALQKTIDGGIEIGVARSEGELKKIFSMRYKEYEKEKLLRFRNGQNMMIEACDKDAFHIYAKDLTTNNIFASGRFTPHRLYYTDSVPVEGNCGEFTRLAIETNNLALIRRAGDLLMKQTERIAQYFNKDSIIIFSRPRMDFYVRKSGFVPLSEEIKFTPNKGAITPTPVKGHIKTLTSDYSH